MIINLILAILVMLSSDGELTVYEDYSARYETADFRLSFDRLELTQISVRDSLGIGIDANTGFPSYPSALLGKRDNIPTYLYLVLVQGSVPE